LGGGREKRLQAGYQRNCGANLDRSKIFSFLQNIQTACEAHPATYLVDAGGILQRVEWLGM